MFDLEKAITEWRAQMLAAGIKTPVPLEELEIHLREETERQANHGLEEAEAFAIAAQNIGDPQQLNAEFRKTNQNMKTKIIALTSIAVLATLFLLIASQSITDYLMPTGQLHSLAFQTINVIGSLLFFPVKLYAYFVYGNHGSWPIPVLVSLLVINCLMWGVAVERIVWLFSKRKAIQ